MAPNDRPQNLFAVIHDRVLAALDALIAEGLLPAAIDRWPG